MNKGGSFMPCGRKSKGSKPRPKRQFDYKPKVKIEYSQLRDTNAKC